MKIIIMKIIIMKIIVITSFMMPTPMFFLVC